MFVILFDSNVVSFEKLLSYKNCFFINLYKQYDICLDYLTERIQCVKIGEFLIAEARSTGYGFAPRSSLGCTLFLVYIYNLYSLKIPNSRVIYYADDTAPILRAKSRSELFKFAQSGLITVTNFLILSNDI